uniref:Uncharacterized protein MANES_06G098000 n=1 Tax=Rhizophora mucronata TaxID=61149 RepID=A0A2P2LQZ9_RHIMU
MDELGCYFPHHLITLCIAFSYLTFSFPARKQETLFSSRKSSSKIIHLHLFSLHLGHRQNHNLGQVHLDQGIVFFLHRHLHLGQGYLLFEVNDFALFLLYWSKLPQADQLLYLVHHQCHQNLDLRPSNLHFQLHQSVHLMHLISQVSLTLFLTPTTHIAGN